MYAVAKTYNPLIAPPEIIRVSKTTILAPGAWETFNSFELAKKTRNGFDAR